MGLDGFRFYFERMRNHLVGMVCDTMRCSKSTDKTPKEWNRTEVVPEYESGNKEEPLKYRPVSLITTVCKMWK